MGDERYLHESTWRPPPARGTHPTIVRGPFDIPATREVHVGLGHP